MKKIVAPLVLVIVYGLLVTISVPAGHVFGSNIDWLCQHVALAETIRDACLAQHTLLPNWLELGGGSNGYQFAYYGFLRPDVLVGCLLPNVSMQIILIVYMLLVGLISVLFMYRWLILETGRQEAAWFGAVLFMTAGCFFHLHRQVMFVNYFPFLLLAFICLKKRKHHWIPLCFLGVCLSSFYYAPAAFIAVGWYWYRLVGKKFWRGWLMSSLVAVGMAAALLLPTALALLEHRSSQSGGVSLLALLTPNWMFSSLLFDKYGMGLSLLALYVLVVCIRDRRLRADAIFLLILCVCPFISYLLNGTLYARAKILMPFLPLVTMLVAVYCSDIVAACKEKNERLLMPLWPFAVLLPVVVCWQHSHRAVWVFIDAGILLLVVILLRFFHLHRYLVVALLLVAPIGLYFANAATEDWVSEKTLLEMTEGVPVDAREMADNMACYHWDSSLHSLERANLQRRMLPRSSMYSSVTNQAYASFYYDTLLAPIQINNRVALLTANDPFLLHLLGTRYLETSSDWLPEGYHVLKQENTAVLGENSSVLPRAYVTEAVVAQSWFETLSPYAKLDVLARKTVIDDPEASSECEAGMSVFSPALFLQHALPDGLQIKRMEEGWLINAQKSCHLDVTLKNPQPGNILLCQFNVDNRTKKPVIIDINGMRNMLSGASAPYPNHNTCFHFKFSTAENDGVQSLSIDLSPGCYMIHHIQWYCYDADNFNKKQFTALRSVSGDGIWNGQITCQKKMVFATTIPIQKGLKIIVDGQEQDIKCINTAFLGCYLSEGKHNICVVFSPPGKRVGMMFSIFSVLCYIIFLFIRSILIRRYRI
ncbi:MAG: YfhO family protein [Peptococcaceae bacterium]|nr:YfhO family protein [Peptococcaceae bacterium]